MPAICKDCNRILTKSVVRTLYNCKYCRYAPIYKCQDCNSFYCSDHCKVVSFEEIEKRRKI